MIVDKVGKIKPNTDLHSLHGVQAFAIKAAKKTNARVKYNRI